MGYVTGGGTGGGSGAVTTVAGRTGDVVIAESDVTSLVADLALKAPLASPTLTGTPLAPTAAQGTNTTQIATTAMVHSEAVLLAPQASPTFTGTAILPTGFDPTAQQAVADGFIGWNGLSPYATAGPSLTSKTMYVAKLRPLARAGTPTKVAFIIQTAGASLTTVATATVTGTQTAPASGGWTLTTSTPSLYASSGIATIGSEIVAYSAWSGTSMTVIAGGYTPSASYAGGATITANSNTLAIYDSSGAFLGATVDQTANWTSNVTENVYTIIPAQAALAAGTVLYVGILSTGSTTMKPCAFSSAIGAGNAGPTALLSGANLRFGATGSGALLAAPSSITPSALSSQTACPWVAVS